MKSYKKRHIPYTVEIQNETFTVRSKRGHYTTRDSTYSIEEINFIKDVKNYIIKNQLYLEHRQTNVKKVMYFKYNRKLKPGNVYHNVINIDLTSAYWETAKMLGLLSDELYLRGQSIRKQVRLAAIGSLAKKRRVYKYDGKKVSLVEQKRNELTEFLWDVICDRVGSLLLATAKGVGGKFIFFWVDGIYVEKGAEGLVKKYFNSAGYECKITKLKSIEVADKNIFVHLIDPEIHNLPKGRVEKFSKPFPFRNSKKKENKFKGYNRDL